DMAMTWKFAGGTWTNLSIAPASEPSPRQTPVMAWDTADSYMVLFGGLNAGSGKPLNDTWKFTGGAWTVLAKGPKTLTPRFSMGMDYDPTMGGLVMFGGANINAALNDSWFFNGGTWTKMTTSHAPSKRGEVSVTWDALDGYAMTYGGSPDFGLSFFSAADTIGPNLTAGFAAVPSVLDIGQNTSLRAEAVGDNSNPASFNYVYANLPTGCTSANKTPLSCFPTVTGAFTVTVTVKDPLGDYRTANASFTVNNQTTITSFSVAPTALTKGQLLNLSMVVKGGTGALTYSYLGLPAGCSSRNVAIFNCTPGAIGNFSITGKVVDTLGYASTATVNITVNPDPLISSFTTSSSLIDVGQNVSLKVVATGGTGALSYLYTNLPPGCTSANSAALNCFPTAAGNYSVTVNATDSVGFTTSKKVGFLVNPPVTASSFSSSPSSIDIGQTVTIQVVANGGTLSFNFVYTGLPAGCASQNLATFSCTPTVTGNFTLGVTVTDSLNGSTSRSANLLVSNGPSIGAVTATPSLLDLGMKFNVSASTSGGSAPYSFTWSGLPAGCPLSKTANLTCTPITTGGFTIKLTLKDSVGKTASGSTFITVNPDPKLSTLTVYPSTVNQGATATFSVSSNGGSGGRTISYTGLPTGCVSNNTTTLACVPKASGMFNVTATVTDALHFNDSKTVLLTVNATGPGPGNKSNNPGTSTLTYAVIGVAILAIAAVVGVLLWSRRPPSAPAAEEETPAEPPEQIYGMDRGESTEAEAEAEPSESMESSGGEELPKES
ncbi:MAG: hypothetical protein L3K09_02980, partial [Thermoplasmata archaeon]|nr:hypothetical protein [Thermoplasmata archaeon]